MFILLFSASCKKESTETSVQKDESKLNAYFPENEITYMPTTDAQRTNEVLDFLDYTNYAKQLNKTTTTPPNYAVMEGAWLFEAASNFHFNDIDLINEEKHDVLIHIDKTADGLINGQDLVSEFNSFVNNEENRSGSTTNMIDIYFESQNNLEVVLHATVYEGEIGNVNQALTYPSNDMDYTQADDALNKLFAQDLYNHWGSWHLPKSNKNWSKWFWVSNVFNLTPLCVQFVSSSDHSLNTVIWRAKIANGNPKDRIFKSTDFKKFHEGRVKYAKQFLALAQQDSYNYPIPPDFVINFIAYGDDGDEVVNNIPLNGSACTGHYVNGYQFRYIAPSLGKMNFNYTYTQ